MHKVHWDLELQTDHLILTRQTDLVIVNKKKTCRIVDFAGVELKDCEKRDKYQDLTGEF